MRVLNVNALIDPVTGGGTAERTVQMSRALRDAGLDCVIVTTDIGIESVSKSELRGIRVIAYPCLVRRFFVPRVQYAELKREVGHADVIHLMGHWSILNVFVYATARALKKPYVVCPAGALQIYGRSRWLKRLYNGLFGRRMVRNASAWIAVTRDERAQFEQYGISQQDVTVIPNGIRADRLAEGDADAFRRTHGLETVPFALFMGRLNAIKGPDLLIEAFLKGADQWPDWHLVLAGPDGGMLAQLQAMVSGSAAHARIHFIGYIGGEDKAAAYRAADLLVIPSRHEAMSIVVLEAGITGTPVLLTDECGFNDVEAAGGGKVVPATVDGMLTGLGTMLADSMKLPAMGRRLQELVRHRYGWDVIVKDYLELYGNIVPSRGV